MGFGDSVKTLLETYSNCVSLLKSLKRPKSGKDGPEPDHQQVTLLKSLRKDRDLVEQTYSSRLSESGGRLRRGDARAISSLDRILQRIRTTVTELLRLSSNKEQKLDYDSLMSLSNTSRIEAIRTINHLSRRLSSNNSSRVSATSSAPAKSTASVPRQKAHSSHRPTHSSSRSSTVSSKSRNKSPPSSPKKKKSIKEEKAPKPREEAPPTAKEDKPARLKKATAPEPKSELSPATKRPTVEFETPPSPPPKRDLDTKPPNRPMGIAQRVAAARENRISIASFASDSTKLGEIPDRRARSRFYTASAPGSEEYNVPPLYPLRPYKAEARERGFWGGLFSRKKEA